MARILIIDDDMALCRTLATLVGAQGHDAVYALSLQEGIAAVSGTDYDMVFLDVQLPDGNGLEAIAEIRKAPSAPEVIILTGEGSADGAELAVKNGAWDYIQKPVTGQSIALPLKRVIQLRAASNLSKDAWVLKREGIIGESPVLKNCLETLALAARTDASVLISGKTGTGKERFARALHANSLRADKAMVVVDCAALPENLTESLLFGHVRGAFTGAEKSREGLVKQAHGGTLFLDEVGEMPLGTQKKFLRVLQERRFRPLGGGHEIESDFRLIAATNQDLNHMAKEGQFREDLLYRLRSVTIDLPPLKERGSDIKDIAADTIHRCCERDGLGPIGFYPEFLEALLAYEWPGNVRELIGAVETAVANARDVQILHPIHLPADVRIRLARASVCRRDAGENTFSSERITPHVLPSFSQLINLTEKKYFHDLIHHTQRDIQAACSVSGLSRAQVYRMLKKHNL